MLLKRGRFKSFSNVPSENTATPSKHSFVCLESRRRREHKNAFMLRSHLLRYSFSGTNKTIAKVASELAAQPSQPRMVIQERCGTTPWKLSLWHFFYVYLCISCRLGVERVRKSAGPSHHRRRWRGIAPLSSSSPWCPAFYPGYAAPAAALEPQPQNVKSKRFTNRLLAYFRNSNWVYSF